MIVINFFLGFLFDERFAHYHTAHFSRILNISILNHHEVSIHPDCYLPAFSLNVTAQKGIPEKEITSATVHSFFPQHEELKESMVNRLKVVAGFKVITAATGLGKPSMLEVGANGILYVTRWDVGDVLMLKDIDGDGKFEELKTIVSQFNNVHGITIHNGWMYLCSLKKLAIGRIAADGFVGKIDTLISDLPEGSQHETAQLRLALTVSCK